MSLRWRDHGKGQLLCAAKCEPEPNDIYICDRLHYKLSVECRAIFADVDEETNGLWHWIDDLLLRVKRV